MHVGFFEAWSGRRHTASACPLCRSPRVRHSRRSYDGLSARIFKVRPVKCLACGSYFAVGGKVAALSDLDLAELQIPFRLSELDPQTEGEVAPDLLPSYQHHSASTLPGRRCRVCGSREARPVRSGPAVSLFRLDAREFYRCSSCNASFTRTSPLRLLVLLTLLSSVLGVAA